MSEALTPHLTREQYKKGYLLNMGKEIANEAYNLQAVETYLSQGESAADAINDSATLTQGIPLATLKAINAVKYRETVENSTAAVQPMGLKEQQFLYAAADGLNNLLKSMMQNGRKVPQYLFRQVVNDVMTQASGVRPTAIDPLIQVAGVDAPAEQMAADGQAVVPNNIVNPGPRPNNQSGMPAPNPGQSAANNQQSSFGDPVADDCVGLNCLDLPEETRPGDEEPRWWRYSDHPRWQVDDSQSDDMPGQQPIDARSDGTYESGKTVYEDEHGNQYQRDEESEEDPDQAFLEEYARNKDDRLIYKPGPRERLTQAEQEYLDEFAPPATEEEDLETLKKAMMLPEPENYVSLADSKKAKEEKKKKKTWQNAWGFLGSEGTGMGGRLLGRNSVPTGVEHMYQRSIRGSGLAAPGKKGKKAQPKRALAPFGRYAIDLQDLKDNKIALYTKLGNKQRRVPTSVVGGSVANVLKSIVIGKRPKPKDILTLDEGEKEYLAGLGMAAKISDLEDMPTKKKSELEKEMHEFEVLRGQIGAGNDNPKLIKEFKTALVKMVRAKKVNSKQAQEILLELADLGH